MKMHLFKMKGSWNDRLAFLYNLVVASGLDHLYNAFAGFFLSDLPEGSRVLDLGCGAGQVAVRVAEMNPKAEVLGVDLSQSQIALARRRGRGLANLSFETGDAMDLRLPEDRFDIVFSMASIKHWPDPIRGLQEMRRVCRPGGRIWVVEADTQSTRQEARDFVANWRWVLPGTRPLVRWYFRFVVGWQGLSLKDLDRLLSEAGFADVLTQKALGQPIVIGTGTKGGAGR